LLLPLNDAALAAEAGDCTDDSERNGDEATEKLLGARDATPSYVLIPISRSVFPVHTAVAYQSATSYCTVLLLIISLWFKVVFYMR